MNWRTLFAVTNMAAGPRAVFCAAPAPAAEVTSDRLVNADPEPRNWLMNHRSYNGQRFSPLARINKDTSRASASPTRSRSADPPALNTRWRRRSPRTASSTPRIHGGVLYKIDGRSGDAGRIVWRMDPKQERQMRNRGAALWGNLVITGAGIAPPRIIATDKETGKVVWETSFPDTPDVTFTSAPLAIKDKIMVRCGQWRPGRPRLDRRARRRDREGHLAQIHHSGARRARQRDLEGQSQCLADRRRRRVGDRNLRSRDQPDHLGHRQPGADVRIRPIGRATIFTPTAPSPGIPTPAR